MKLKSHGRYDYSAITERKDYSWPGGKRLAARWADVAKRAGIKPQD